MNRVYLTRHNLLTLLNKLDRQKAGGATMCTIVKSDTAHKKYPITVETAIIAVEDEDYYDEREPGPVHPLDDPMASNS
jgi:hypothetical protein